MKKLTRRGFLVLLAGGGSLFAASWFRGRRVRTIALELPHILALDAHTEMIGRQYLRKVPEEADPDRLSELILSELPWNVSMGTDVRALIREQVRRDFEQDRTVRLGQWMLSQTEARLCALTALANRSETVG